MSWNGVKKQSLEQEIKSWCDEMGIENYTINSRGKIDVDENVNLSGKNFKELPYKFGKVFGYFSLSGCKCLTSLKNCPDFVRGSVSCSLCSQLDSLKGCPKEIGGYFYCRDCKRKFSKEEVESLSEVRDRVYV